MGGCTGVRAGGSTRGSTRGPRGPKNCSKHQTLSISVAYNVISCKKSKETLKKSKSRILLFKFGSQAQKWRKIPHKNRSLKRDLLKKIIGMVYFGCYLLSRRFRICLAKGGRVFKAELRAPEVDPRFERKLQCQKEQARPQFSKYRFQNESAASHSLWANTDSFWKRYFVNCGRACFFYRLILVFLFLENRVNFGRP